MPDTVVCAKCGRTGWVRFERIIRGADYQRLYYCGACDHTWSVPEAAKAPPAQSSPEARRRSTPTK
jgi:hypothetical protein